MVRRENQRIIATEDQRSAGRDEMKSTRLAGTTQTQHHIGQGRRCLEGATCSLSVLPISDKKCTVIVFGITSMPN